MPNETMQMNKMSNVISIHEYRAKHGMYPFKKPLVVYSKLDFHDWMFYNVNGYKELNLRLNGAERIFSREIERIKNILQNDLNCELHDEFYYNNLINEAKLLMLELKKIRADVNSEIKTLAVDFLKKNGYDGIVFEEFLHQPFCDNNKFAEQAFFRL